MVGNWYERLMLCREIEEKEHENTMYAREAQCAEEESLDQLIEELENEMVGEEGEGEWSVWLEAECRPIPNG